MLGASPVTSVETIAADQIERASDILTIAFRHHKKAAICHRLAEHREEAAVEVGIAPLAASGLDVEREEGVPVRFGDVISGDVLNRETGAQRLGALLAHRLALARRETREEIVESRVARILPMELLVGALQPRAIGADPCPLGRADECCMNR